MRQFTTRGKREGLSIQATAVTKGSFAACAISCGVAFTPERARLGCPVLRKAPAPGIYFLRENTIPPTSVKKPHVHSLKFIGKRSLLGIVIRGILIVFALAGMHHFLRMAVTPPTLSTLYPVWLGSRELLVHGRNPYAPEVNREIQTAFYGAPLDPGDHLGKECCFAYPVYVSFLLAPGVRSEFFGVQSAALVFLIAVTAISVVCWHVVTRRETRQLVFVIPLVLISPPVMQGLDLRQPALLVAALLSVAAALVDRGRFALAGVALALATIKPQMCLLPIAWMLLWAIHGWAVQGWAARKNLVVGFAGSMAALIGGGELLLPGWIADFVAQLRVYRHFAGASVLEILYGRGIGLGLGVALVSGLLLLMWRRKSAQDFMPTLALVLAVEVFFVPGLKSLLNLVLLIPGIFLLLTKYPVKIATGRTNFEAGS